MQPLPERTPSVSVVVLSWNRQEQVERCLASLARAEYPSFGVMVVDNGSTGFDPEILPTKFEGIELVKNSSNLGVAGGRNVALRRLLLERTTEFVLFLDDDTTAHPRLIRRLVEAHDTQRGWDILQPAVYDFAEPEKTCSLGGRFNRWTGAVRLLRKPPRATDPADEALPVDFASGCGLFAHRTLFEALGQFDEAFRPLYGEDIDFCLRARRRGYGCAVVPDAILWREVETLRPGLANRALAHRIETQVRLMRKHARPVQWITWIFMAPFLSIGSALGQVLRGRPFGSIAVVHGYARGLMRRAAGGRTA